MRAALTAAEYTGWGQGDCRQQSTLVRVRVTAGQLSTQAGVRVTPGQQSTLVWVRVTAGQLSTQVGVRVTPGEGGEGSPSCSRVHGLV